MKALTLRGIDEAMDCLLKRRAKELGLSVNATILQMLRQVCGQDKTRRSAEFSDLDAMAGPWTREEQEEFDRNVRAFSEIDKDLWK